MTSIDYKNKFSISKGKYLQLSQETGKHYPKFLRSVISHTWQPVKKYRYRLPSKELRDAYEVKKSEFVERTIMALKVHEDMQREKEVNKLGGNGRPFTERQEKIQELFHQGITIQREIAEKFDIGQSEISQSMVSMTKKYPKWRDMPRKNEILGISAELAPTQT
jgi:hypothetical protein